MIYSFGPKARRFHMASTLSPSYKKDRGRFPRRRWVRRGVSRPALRLVFPSLPRGLPRASLVSSFHPFAVKHRPPSCGDRYQSTTSAPNVSTPRGLFFMIFFSFPSARRRTDLQPAQSTASRRQSSPPSQRQKPLSRRAHNRQPSDAPDRTPQLHRIPGKATNSAQHKMPFRPPSRNLFFMTV